MGLGAIAGASRALLLDGNTKNLDFNTHIALSTAALTATVTDLTQQVNFKLIIQAKLFFNFKVIIKKGANLKSGKQKKFDSRQTIKNIAKNVAKSSILETGRIIVTDN